jgi:hypothetical protein
MPEVTSFTDPLSGYDPIEDCVGQLRKFMRRDCSLRREDGYSGGFQGEIKIKLDCFAVRTVHIEMTVPITIPPEVKASLDALPVEQLDKFEIEETIVIPREENLNLVRERIRENSAENLENDTPAPEDEENLVAVAPHAKRKYTRRTALVGAGE